MRVAVTVEQCWHRVPGGIAVSTVELLRALTARGDVDLVGVSARHEHPPAADLIPPVPVRALPLPRRVLYETWQWLRIPRVERAAGSVDLVHDLGYTAPPSTAPLIATVHDLLFLRFPEHYTAHTRIVLRRGLALARRHARLVICPSRATIAACRAAGFGPDRLRLVPWGARPFERGSDGRARERHGLHRPYVLFVGTLEPRKNLRRVVDAFAGLDGRDLELVLIGPKGWKEDPRLDRAADRVRWLGPVPRDELPELYEGATAVVYASLAEGFGLPVLEAMSAGAAVVTSAGTAMEEVAGGAAVLVDPIDVRTIRDGIDRIVRDGGFAAELRARASERAKAFSWERSAGLVADVYAEAMGLGP